MKNLALILASAALSTATAPAPGSQWKKTLFLDDFTGGAGAPPSSSNWIMQTGTQYPGGPTQWGTGEVETYTSSSANVQQNGKGSLLITAVKNPSGQWTSARIETKLANFMAPAGGKMRIEASIAIPLLTTANGQGYWPAFWALGNGERTGSGVWPAIGEFDVMEHVNAQSSINQGLHCGTNPGGACNEPNGIGHSATCPTTDCMGNFHTYTLIVDRSASPASLNYYIDQKLQSTVTATQLGASLWNQTVAHGFFLIANMAMGGGYPNAVAGVTTPTADTVSGKSMKIDYVAVWTT